MLKELKQLRDCDPAYTEAGGFGYITLGQLHVDMAQLELPASVPDSVRRVHDAVRHAYIYSYFSYDLLPLGASQIFPCVELAFRERLGDQWRGRTHRDGTSRRPTLFEMLQRATEQGLITTEVGAMRELRNIFMHGIDAVLDPNIFLGLLTKATSLIAELYECDHRQPPPQPVETS